MIKILKRGWKLRLAIWSMDIGQVTPWYHHLRDQPYQNWSKSTLTYHSKSHRRGWHLLRQQGRLQSAEITLVPLVGPGSPGTFWSKDWSTNIHHTGIKRWGTCQRDDGRDRTLLWCGCKHRGTCRLKEKIYSDFNENEMQMSVLQDYAKELFTFPASQSHTFQSWPDPATVSHHYLPN